MVGMKPRKQSFPGILGLTNSTPNKDKKRQNQYMPIHRYQAYGLDIIWASRYEKRGSKASLNEQPYSEEIFEELGISQSTQFRTYV
jgi:hypothetical protein